MSKQLYLYSEHLGLCIDKLIYCVRSIFPELSSCQSYDSSTIYYSFSLTDKEFSQVITLYNKLEKLKLFI